MLHDFGNTQVGDMDADFFDHFMHSELDYYLNHDEGLSVIANQYVGLPYEALAL